MIDISVSLTARDARKDKIKGSTTVVIDVLRATSVIITALYNGADWVLPVSQVEDAWMYKEKFSDSILGGERDALKIQGFDTGNSPLEYTREKVQNRGIILTTTNGTQALNNTNGAVEVLLAAFINLSSLVEYLSESKDPVHILCSGTQGEFSADDFLCAGGIISRLGLKTQISKDDLGNLAQSYWEGQKGNPALTLGTTRHYNTLKNRGFTRDLEYCLSIDTHQIIPKMDLRSGFIK